MQVTASIVLYNNSPGKVERVVQNLTDSSLRFRIFVVDNSEAPVAINPGILDLIDYIKTPKNIGFGAAHNIAIQKSIEMGSRYHLVLNPDVDLQPGTVEEVYSYLRLNPDVGNVMPLVCYPDGTNQYLAKLLPCPADLVIRLLHPVLPRKLVHNVNQRYELHFLPLDNPIQVPSLSGCFMFLRCDALRKSGLFDERFFLYFEDYDLIRRISTHYKVVYYPLASIVHHFERASRKNISALCIHLASAVKYFNKWGWHMDEHREMANTSAVSRIIKESGHGGPVKSRRGGTTRGSRIKSIALITNQACSMLNFRGRLIEDLAGRGVKVYAMAPDYSDRFREKSAAMGAEPVDFDLDRIGVNPARYLLSLLKLTGILSRLKPDAVLNIFIKPVVYGSWAARRAGVKNIYSMISGLGYMFASSPGKASLKKPFFRDAASLLYKSALARNRKVFFHNPDDLALFVSQGMVEINKAVRIFGSGVDLGYYAARGIDQGRPFTFLLASRLRTEKGVREYIQAAKLVKRKHPDIRFVLLGGMDINPSGLKEAEIREWVDQGIVDWPGQVEDVRPWLNKCWVYVLPSWREGTPGSTLEALASGRAVITTDVPGCRETIALGSAREKLGIRYGRERVMLGKNGLLIPVRDPLALASAMEHMILNRDMVVEMGRQSRKIAEEHYDVRKVNAVILREMGVY